MVFKSSCLVDLVAFSSQCALLSISSDAGQSGTLVGFPPSGGSSAGGGGMCSPGELCGVLGSVSPCDLLWEWRDEHPWCCLGLPVPDWS